MESRTSYRGVCGERQTGKKRQGKASDWRMFETCAEDRSDPARRRQEIDKGTSFMEAEDGLLVYVNRGNLYVTVNFACMISFDGHLRN